MLSGLMKTSWWLTFSALWNLLVNGGKGDWKFPSASDLGALRCQSCGRMSLTQTLLKRGHWQPQSRLDSKQTYTNTVLKTSVYKSPLPMGITWLSATYFMEHEVRQCHPVNALHQKDVFQRVYLLECDWQVSLDLSCMRCAICVFPQSTCSLCS